MHTLQPRDPASRVHFCSSFLQCVVEGEIDPQLKFLSDEAWFYFQRYITTHNNRHWSSQSPHVANEILLHSVKVQEGLLHLFILTKQLIAKDMYRSFSGNSFQG
jgi:hypothetical protein